MATLKGHFAIFLLVSSLIIPSDCNRLEDKYTRVEKRQVDGFNLQTQNNQENQVNHHASNHYAVPSFNGLSFPAPSSAGSSSSSSKAPLIMPPNNQLQVNNFRNNQQNLLASSSSSYNSAPLRGPSTSSESDAKFAQTNEDFLHARIGLAMRQAANGDDNFFHPISLIGAPQVAQQHQEWPSSPVRQLLSPVSTTSPLGTTTTTTTTTTEHNNNIEVAPFHESSSSSGVSSGEHMQQSNQPILMLNSNQNSTVDINNQVIYEGPATAPPAGDNYYFSSSERLPNTDPGSKPSNAWW